MTTLDGPDRLDTLVDFWWSTYSEYDHFQVTLLGRTDTLPRMKLVSLVLIGIVGLGGVARAEKVDPLTAALTKLGDAAKCSDAASLFRPWCIAVDFPKGTVPALPRKALVGMTVELEDGKDFHDALINRVTFVAIAVDKDGKVKLTDVKPTSADETKAMMEAVGAAALVFKGKAETAKLPKELSDYVKTLKGAYKTKKENGSITWKGANSSQLRKVGKFYVVIEKADKGNGIWASILTDTWE